MGNVLVVQSTYHVKDWHSLILFESSPPRRRQEEACAKCTSRFVQGQIAAPWGLYGHASKFGRFKAWLWASWNPSSRPRRAMAVGIDHHILVTSRNITWVSRTGLSLRLSLMCPSWLVLLSEQAVFRLS